jgi:hypothetical protein
MLVTALLVVAASTPLKLLLGGAAITVGMVVGLVPALLLGMLLGLIPRPRVLRPRRVAHPAPQRQPTVALPGVRAVPTAAPRTLDAPAVVLPSSMRQRIEPALEEADIAIARQRHRRLYDDEYARQLEHLETLRRTIRTRMAVDAQPLSEDAPRES